MKFPSAVLMSVVFHISLFTIIVTVPKMKFNSGTTYYVDLISLPGGGGRGGGGKISLKKTSQQLAVKQPERLRDLKVAKEPESKFRYPDKNLKKNNLKKKPVKEEENKVTVIRKDLTAKNTANTKTKGESFDSGPNVLSTGISSGSGSGAGDGSGEGPGGGSGSGLGSNFPYAYYIETLRNKISSAWYSSLVSPGLQGSYLSIVSFKILKNGRVEELELENNSGVESLDLSSLRAVENAQPFPPLPSDFPYDFLKVHFEFEWKK